MLDVEAVPELRQLLQAPDSPPATVVGEAGDMRDVIDALSMAPGLPADLKARIAELKAAGATKGQLAPLRTELQDVYFELRCAKLDAEIRANWLGVAFLDRLPR